MKLNEKFSALDSSVTDPRTRRYLVPKRVVLTEGDVTNAEALLKERSNQITLVPKDVCVMKNEKGKPTQRSFLTSA